MALSRTRKKTRAAHACLYRLLDEASETHEQIHIIGKKTNAILVSEEDWRAIQETLYLTSIPEIRRSIIEGMKTPTEE